MILEALVVLGVLYGIAQILLQEVEDKAGKEYERFLLKSREYEAKIVEARREIQREVEAFRGDAAFHELCNLHHRSANVADKAYEALQFAKSAEWEIGSTIGKVKQKRDELSLKRKKARRARNESASVSYQRELDSLFRLKDALYEQLAIIKSKREQFHSQLKALNMETRQLKFRIRDSGPRGYRWYQELGIRTNARKKRAR